jgi:tight adherence protein C
VDIDVVGLIINVVTFLMIGVAGFFLIYGIWESLLKKVFYEAQQLDEKSNIKALRKVILQRLTVINRRFIWPKYEQRINRKILNAGGLDGLNAVEFMALQELSCVGFGLFGLLLIRFMQENLNYDVNYFWVLMFFVGGWFFPESWLRDQVKKRHHRITRELPYNLDLLTLSVEAGLDFQAAVATVVQKGKKGPLGDELMLMLKQLRLGKTRQEALRLMAENVNLDALSSFVNALIQADRMGTSLGKVLRIQSTQLRIERTQRAEKLANEAPVKMLFPLIACIFPTVFMVLFGPIIFQLMTGEF